LYTVTLILIIIINIAFFTLLERKILSYCQYRKGPNKISLIGFLQPFRDIIKLFTKNFEILFKYKLIFYIISPLIIINIFLLIWFNLSSPIKRFNFSIIFYLALLRILSYPILLSGIKSSCLYSFLGRIRRVRQYLSYEISIILVILIFINVKDSYSFFSWRNNYSFIYLNIILLITLFISGVAELNRSPFDFSEGESELVSGFNTEYYGINFSLIFLAEYGIILFFSIIFRYLFIYSKIIIILTIILILYLRRRYPRVRYDFLILFSWLYLVPILFIFYIIIIM
jgi:NADH-ubiquinone oxidoreductase chain 1